MNKVVPAAWETVCIAAALVLVVAVVRFFHLNAFNPLLVGIPIYLALLFLVVRLARSIPLPVGTVSWWRLGLVLGGIIGLYMIALNLLDALAPIHGPQNSYGDNVGPVWLFTLPLLAGVVGIVAGYASGRARTGAVAGILGGGLMLFLQIATTVRLVAVLWNALRANSLHSQLQAGTRDWIQNQWSVQHPGAPPSLWTYLTKWDDDSSIAFGIVYKSFYTAIAWLLPVMVGSEIGARSVRRARDGQRQVGADGQEPGRGSSHLSRHPVRLTVLLLALGILIWSAFTVLAGRLADGSLSFLLGYLRASFVTPAFVAWLLVFVAIVSVVYLPARPVAIAPAVERTDG